MRVLAVRDGEERPAFIRAEGFDCSAEEIAAEGDRLTEADLKVFSAGTCCGDLLRGPVAGMRIMGSVCPAEVRADLGSVRQQRAVARGPREGPRMFLRLRKAVFADGVLGPGRPMTARAPRAAPRRYADGRLRLPESESCRA